MTMRAGSTPVTPQLVFGLFVMALGVILGGGRGTRLHPLTHQRSKPAVPIGGKYRLIDIPISNCLNSGLRRIFVLTQYNSESLNKHLTMSYKFDVFSSAFVTVLAAEQTEDSPEWFQGTADAVRQSMRHLMSHRSREVLISTLQLHQRFVAVQPAAGKLLPHFIPVSNIERRDPS